MKRRRLQLTVSLVVGLALTLVLTLLIGQFTPVRGDPDVLYVAPGGDCHGASPCYASVQAAVDVADSGDEIRVAAGIYTGVSAREGVTQVVYVSQTVTIRGGYTTDNWTASDPDANLTTLDAEGQGRVLYLADDVTPTVEGLRITGGDASGLSGGYWGWDCGGGVYVDHGSTAVQLNNNQVFSNAAYLGGGICLYYGAATLRGNEIFLNTAAEGSGGGLWLDRTEGVVLDSNAVFSNSAEQGGGAYLYSGSGAFLKGNVVESNVVDFNGAGLYVDSNDATLEDNIIRGNVVSVGGPNWWNGGGGLQMRISDAVLVNNAVVDNESAAATGGGIKIRGGSVHMLHNTFARNSAEDGSGIEILAEPNWGGCNLVLTNTILVSHTVGISVTGGNTVTVNSVLWHDTPITVSQSITSVVMVQNQFTGDPAFATDGYHILPTSAAVDAGIDAGVDTDIDGQTRPQGAGFDLGAHELGPPPTLTINHTDGRPSSFFHLTGSNFPPNETASVTVNGTILTDALTIDGSGDAAFLLDTSQADPGRYSVIVKANPTAMASFTLDPSAPLRPQEGTGPILEVPGGIAIRNIVYLPLVQR